MGYRGRQEQRMLLPRVTLREPTTPLLLRRLSRHGKGMRDGQPCRLERDRGRAIGFGTDGCTQAPCRLWWLAWWDRHAAHSVAMVAWRVIVPLSLLQVSDALLCLVGFGWQRHSVGRERTRRPIDQVNSVCALGSAGMTPPVRQSCRHMPPCAANRPPDAQTYR